MQLRDNLASAGDHIVTRRNDRSLVTSSGSWVVNGDVWTVLEVHADGAASLRKHVDGSTITLPGEYLAEHTHLGYATTAHRAQGMTVAVCHSLVTLDDSNEQLYVSATRGRSGNHLWVVVDSDQDLIRENEDLSAPERSLSAVLERRSADRLSAHQIIEDSQREVGSLARLGAVYEDAVGHATAHCLEERLASHGLTDVTADRQWPALVDRVRALTLGGYQVGQLLDQALEQRHLSDARSVAGVLHWRLDQYTADLATVRPLGANAAIPAVDHPSVEVARQAAELMSQRWRDLRAQLETGPTPAWLEPLGPRPGLETAERSWLTAATAVAAYRERYELADHMPMLGERPAGVRPDAQALYDHAQLVVDRYAARRLEHLTTVELAELDARQQVIIDQRPHFDPGELEQVRRNLDAAARTWRTSPTSGHRSDAGQQRTRAQRHVERLERRAEAHRRWRAAATIAQATKRQISVVLARRTTRDRHR